MEDSNSYLVIGGSEASLGILSRLYFLGLPTKFLSRRFYRGQKLIHVKGWGLSENVFPMELDQLQRKSVTCVILALPAYDLLGAGRRYLPYIPHDIPLIVLCQGAMQSICRDLMDQFSEHQWRLATSNIGMFEHSQGVYEVLSGGSKFFWGLPKAGLGEPTWLLPTEEELVRKDRQEFFIPVTQISKKMRTQWFVDTVVESLVVISGESHYGALLNDLTTLREVAEEAYMLADLMWEGWSQSFDDLFMELVGYIARFSSRPALMRSTSQRGRKTLNPFLAGCARQYRGFKRLKKLADDVDAAFAKGRV